MIFDCSDLASAAPRLTTRSWGPVREAPNALPVRVWMAGRPQIEKADWGHAFQAGGKAARARACGGQSNLVERERPRRRHAPTHLSPMPSAYVPAPDRPRGDGPRHRMAENVSVPTTRVCACQRRNPDPSACVRAPRAPRPNFDVLLALRDEDSSLGRLTLLGASCFNALCRDGPGLTCAPRGV